MANDFLTLEEISGQHDDMMKAVIAKSSNKIFDDIYEAARYNMWCTRKALSNLGIELHKDMLPEIIDAILKAKKVEVQNYKSGEYRGTFIYKDSELQYYISDIWLKKSQIVFHKEKWGVITNVC